ncbi:MAG: EamA family transporter [Verrucomicrobiota bacterium]|nr:EamA family transporter [Verrucomicrobiota bacterium]
MAWIFYGLLSAVFLGLYDLFKKYAVDGNAVLPVIFYSTVASALVWLPFWIISRVSPAVVADTLLYVAPMSPLDHARLLLKATIVASSWVFTYFAIKHLPISLAGPIRATGPLWTLVGALLLFSERPGTWQWVGIGMTLIGFAMLSRAGRLEGIHFAKDRWIIYMVAGTVMGSVSTLYDKYLLNTLHIPVAAVQCWFSIYLVLVFAPLAYGWWRRWWPRATFHWRWSIPLIGLALLAGDYAYFTALADPHAMIAVLACLRRGSTLIAFAGGIILFREANGWKKIPALTAILLGITIIVVG